MGEVVEFEERAWSGDARSLGEGQGRAFRGRTREILDAVSALPLFPAWSPALVRRGLTLAAARAAGSWYLRAHRTLLERHRAGHYAELFEGLAAALGLPLSTVYGLNAFEIESALPTVRLGCTALALSPDLTDHGRPLIAYNHDFPPSFEPFLFLRRTRPQNGIESLAVTYPVMAGAVAGVNAAGLAVTVNQAFATDASRRAPALLTTLLVSDLLDQCRDVADARVACLGRTLACGAILTLVDASGARAVVELSAHQSAVRTAPRERILHAFNQYLDPGMQAVEVPIGAVTTGIGAGYDIHRCNLERQARFDRIAQHGARHDHARLQALLGDHDGTRGTMDTICVHGDAMNATILSALLDPAERSIHVARGRACQARYERHTLGPVTSGRVDADAAPGVA